MSSQRFSSSIVGGRDREWVENHEEVLERFGDRVVEWS
jgi:hypothetical protein